MMVESRTDVREIGADPRKARQISACGFALNVGPVQLHYLGNCGSGWAWRA
jgi:hypothetical protein